MVQKCSVYNCKSRHVKDCGISFHKFPNDPETRKQWVIATKRKNFVPSVHSRICSKHFAKDQFRPYCNNFMLKAGAVPTLLDCLNTNIPKKWRIVHNEQNTVSEEREKTVPDETDKPKCKVIQIKTSENDSRVIKILMPTDIAGFEKKSTDILPISVLLSSNKPKTHTTSIETEKKDSNVTDTRPNELQTLQNDRPTSKISIPCIHAGEEATDVLPTSVVCSNESKTRPIPSKETLRRKVKILQQRLRRRDRKIRSLKDKITVMKGRLNAPQRLIDTLQNIFSGNPLEEVLVHSFEN